MQGKLTSKTTGNSHLMIPLMKAHMDSFHFYNSFRL